MTLAKLRQAFFSCFKPPFEGLPALVWLYFVFCFLIYPKSHLFSGLLVDSDDYTVLTHTLDWLKGQDWFDVVQHRMNPPDGVSLHFSRLYELPLGLIILIVRHTGLEWLPAAIITAAIWPPFLFACLLAVLCKIAESFLPHDWARAIVYVALCAVPLTFQYMPGRVDHHGFALLLIALAYLCVLRMMEEPENIKWSFGAGFFLALGQAVALETLPWLLVMSTWVGLWMMVRGRIVVRTGLVFGLALYCFSVLFLIMTIRPEYWFNPNPLAFSIIFVLLSGFIALTLATVAAAAQMPYVKFRYVSGFVVAGLAALVFFFSFPDLLAGPYGAIDKALHLVMFDHVTEMMSAALTPQPVSTLLFMLSGLLACIGLFPKIEEQDLRPKWTFSFFLLFTAFMLASFYQVRFASYAVLFSLTPLTLFLQRGLAGAHKQWRGQKLVGVEVCLVLLVGLLPGVLLPSLIDGRTFNKGILLFPVQYPKQTCNHRVLADALNDPQKFGDKPLLIMNSINEGSSILFATHHSVLAAPYHTNVTGILDTVRFFMNRDPVESEKIARLHKADLVVMCRELPMMFRGTGPQSSVKDSANDEPNWDKEEALESLTPESTFAEQMNAGKIPAWIEPVKIPAASHALAFKIKPPQLTTSQDLKIKNSSQGARAKQARKHSNLQ